MDANITTMQDIWLTAKDIARELKVSPDTIYRFIRAEGEDRLEASQIGTQWRVKRSALDRWLEKHSNYRQAKDQVDTGSTSPSEE